MGSPATSAAAAPARRRATAVAVAVGCALAGCASAPDRVADAGGLQFIARGYETGDWPLQPAGERVQGMAWRLKTGAVAWCGAHVRHETGLSFASPQTDARLSITQRATSSPPADGPPIVLYVAPGSAAERAGVAPGDVVEAIDGTPVHGGEEGQRQLAAWTHALAASGQPTAVQFRRGEEPRPATLAPDRVCALTPVLTRSQFEHVYPQADGRVVITDRLVDSLDDADLAFTLAHVVAHGLLGHVGQKSRSGNLAAVVDIPFMVTGVALAIASMGAYPQAAAMPFTTINDARLRNTFEPQADLWATGMMAAAGFDPAGSTGWQLVDDLASFRRPATKAVERRAALAQAAAAIDTARRNGQPMTPEAMGWATPPR